MHAYRHRLLLDLLVWPPPPWRCPSRRCRPQSAVEGSALHRSACRWRWGGRGGKRERESERGGREGKGEREGGRREGELKAVAEELGEEGFWEEGEGGRLGGGAAEERDRVDEREKRRKLSYSVSLILSSPTNCDGTTTAPPLSLSLPPTVLVLSCR